jgi:hypothetical protein
MPKRLPPERLNQSATLIYTKSKVIDSRAVECCPPPGCLAGRDTVTHRSLKESNPYLHNLSLNLSWFIVRWLINLHCIRVIRRQGHISWGSYGLPKVLLGPAMIYHCTYALQAAAPEMGLWQFLGWLLAGKANCDGLNIPLDIPCHTGLVGGAWEAWKRVRFIVLINNGVD